MQITTLTRHIPALALLLLGCGRAGLEAFPGDDAGGGGSSGGNGGNGGAIVSSGGQGGSGGIGGACSVAQECDDQDLCTTDRCDGGQCNHVPRDEDNDGVAPFECGGNDCNDFNPETFPGHVEDCTDGDDNDCNGVADCLDPVCVGQECGCVPSSEVCDNAKDDDCDGFADCFDVDCAGTQVCGCLPSEGNLCVNGFDDDCDGALDCDDSDCFSSASCQCQAQGESCFDDEDNDCDLLVDCADPNCFGVFPCACVPPGVPEQCNNDADDDCDGLPDCADPDCFLSASCQQCTAEVCNDGLDNNCDNRIDCADPTCLFAPNCAPQPEICNNGLDDDNDQKIDCQDPDCAATPVCQQQQANCLSPKLITGSGTFVGDTTGHQSETKGACGGDAGEAVFFFVLSQPSFVELTSSGTSFDSTIYVRTGACNSGREIGCDDDSAGGLAARVTFPILYPGTYYVFLDGYTVDPQQGPNEGPFQLNVTITPNPVENCHDGIDNDGDVHVDCADSDCTFDGVCLNCNGGLPPEPEFAPGRCTDGRDNDCDGTVDCADEDCSASDYYTTECCNGLDETGNGVIDDFNCRCANDSDCDGGQLCYGHTVRACGIPCEAFFGDVCPFIAPGSFCNATTQQCEFP